MVKKKRSLYKIGDAVTLVKIPPAVKDTPVETISVFKSAVGKTFRVAEIDEHGHLELWVKPMECIFVEPEFVRFSKG